MASGNDRKRRLDPEGVTSPHRVRAWLLVVALFTVMITVIGVSQPESWFLVRKVTVQGNLNYQTPRQVYTAVAPAVHSGFFTVDTREVRRRAESLPWIDQVSVRRIWPGTLLVHVTEHVPVALWQDGRLVDQQGTLFSVAQMPPQLALPRLSGPQGSEQLVMRKYRDLQLLLASVTPAIRTLELDDRRAWTMRLDNDLVVNIGRDFRARKIERLVRYYPELFAGREQGIASLDLRYTNGISVRWKPGVDPDTKRVRDVEES